MDGDRPVVDGRDIFESKLQELVRDAFWEGWIRGLKRDSRFNLELYDEATHKLLVSYFDGPTGDVGAQDETSETRAVGNRVRPKPHLRGFGIGRTVFDEINDEFIRHMSLRFDNHGCVQPIGHAKLTRNPDGSIHASIEYGPTKPQVNGPI